MQKKDKNQNIVGEKTRAVYHKQHLRVVNDKVAMNRFLNMITEKYFELGKDYFAGKRILDAGCGENMKNVVKFYKFGSRDLVGLDLGEEFIPVAKMTLDKYGVDRKCVELVSGDVGALPFSDEEFDFVCCHGVLLHLSDFKQVERAFSELVRVTKRGGYLYTVYGCYGGVLEGAVVPALRDYYRKNDEFKSLIDNISKEDFGEVMFAIKKGMESHTKETISLGLFAQLLDTDLCVTIQNVMQAPVRLQISPEYILRMYTKYGFSKAKRLKRYVTRKNIRKYFAPLHFDRNNRFSKILYGSGNLEYIARKN